VSAKQRLGRLSARADALPEPKREDVPALLARAIVELGDRGQPLYLFMEYVDQSGVSPLGVGDMCEYLAAQGYSQADIDSVKGLLKRAAESVGVEWEE